MFNVHTPSPGLRSCCTPRNVRRNTHYPLLQKLDTTPPRSGPRPPVRSAGAEPRALFVLRCSVSARRQSLYCGTACVPGGCGCDRRAVAACGRPSSGPGGSMNKSRCCDASDVCYHCRVSVRSWTLAGWRGGAESPRVVCVWHCARLKVGGTVTNRSPSYTPLGRQIVS